MLPVEVLGCVAFPACSPTFRFLMRGCRRAADLAKGPPPAAFLRLKNLGAGVGGPHAGRLLALLIAFVSGLAAIGAAAMGLRERMRGDKYALWWVASAIILVIPVVALLILA
jgi:hypothetical protein